MTTGIVRRIDELGRIVIPKEIRKSLKITENDNLEISVDEDRICIKKHTLLDNNLKIINTYGKVLRELTNKNVIISNRESIIYCNNNIKDTFFRKEISDEVISLINNRNNTTGEEIEVIKNIKIKNYICSPIIVNSDSIGSIILYSDNEIKEDDKLSIKIISKILNECLE